MDLQIYAETIAARHGVPTDAVLTYAQAMVGIEAIGDVEYGLDLAILVLQNGQNDRVIDTLAAGHAPHRTRGYRGKHRN